MRHTLIMMKLLVQQSFDIFHHIDTGEERDVLTSFCVELCCSCLLPDDERMYFQCEACENWYHPHCEDKGHMSKTQMEKEVLFCRACVNNSYVASRHGRSKILETPKN